MPISSSFPPPLINTAMAPAGPFPKELQIGAKLPNIIGPTQLGVLRVHDYMDGAWGVILTFPQTHHPVWMTVRILLGHQHTHTHTHTSYII